MFVFFLLFLPSTFMIRNKQRNVFSIKIYDNDIPNKLLSVTMTMFYIGLENYYNSSKDNTTNQVIDIRIDSMKIIKRKKN